MPVYKGSNKIDTIYHPNVVKTGEVYKGSTLVYQSAFAITYHIDSSAVYTELVKPKESVLSPSTFTPTKEGWEFVGWRKDTDANSSVLTTQTATEAMDLYAVFRAAVLCTFSDGDGYTEDFTVYRYYNNGKITNASVTAPAGYEGEVDGWSFRGWAAAGVTMANASVAYAGDEIIYNISSDCVFYSLEQKTIKLSYDGNGSTGGSTSTQQGTAYWNGSGNRLKPTFTIMANGFTKTYYSFANWRLNSPSGTAYSPGASIELSHSATMYATWNVASSTATLTYDSTLQDPNTTDGNDPIVPFASASIAGGGFQYTTNGIKLLVAKTVKISGTGNAFSSDSTYGQGGRCRLIITINGTYTYFGGEADTNGIGESSDGATMYVSATASLSAGTVIGLRFDGSNSRQCARNFKLTVSF